jgi:hypothetical protein
VEIGDKVLAHLGIDTEPSEVLVSSTGRRGDDSVFFYDGHTKWEYTRKVVRVVSPTRKSLYDKISEAATQHGMDDDPDHEVGDLQDALRDALSLMTPAQLKQLEAMSAERIADGTTTPPAIVELNRERDLYFVTKDGRIIFIPKGWCNEFDDDNEKDDGPSIYGWIGQESTSNWATRSSKEWLTSETQGWTLISDLDKMREASAEEARQLDPDLFALLDAVNSNQAT